MILVVLFRKGFVTARTSRPDTFRAANLLLRHEDVFSRIYCRLFSSDGCKVFGFWILVVKISRFRNLDPNLDPEIAFVFFVSSFYVSNSKIFKNFVFFSGRKY